MTGKNRTTNDLRGRLGRKARGLLGGTLGFAAVAAVLVLMAPLSSAHGTVTFTAPYTGFTTTPSVYANASGCAQEKTPVPQSWNSTTGSYQFSAAAHSGLCSSFNSAYSDAYTTISSTAFLPPTTGFGYAYATFTSSFDAQAALKLPSPTNSTNSTGYGYASVYLYVDLELLDVSHHRTTYVASAYSYLVDQYFYGASSSFNLNQGSSTSYLFAYGNLTAGHLYQVQISIDASIYTYTYGGGAQASASLDLGGSHGVTVNSITVY